MLWIFFKTRTNLFNGLQKEMLHVAPEPVFQKLLSKQLGEGYLTADLYNPAAMVKMDITDIQYPDNTFDVIYCSHVLEHVDDDKKAMKEFYRTLKPDGWAILLVPILEGPTYEDPSITDPQERLKAFGQEDHVRKYGTDLVYLNRLKEAGFNVQITEASEFLDSEQITRMGITEAAQDIYYCTKS
ncbi:MAG: methyltransferase domain-containing protein [Sulfurimonadaceae bacterium]